MECEENLPEYSGHEDLIEWVDQFGVFSRSAQYYDIAREVATYYQITLCDELDASIVGWFANYLTVLPRMMEQDVEDLSGPAHSNFLKVYVQVNNIPISLISAEHRFLIDESLTTSADVREMDIGVLWLRVDAESIVGEIRRLTAIYSQPTINEIDLELSQTGGVIIRGQEDASWSCDPAEASAFRNRARANAPDHYSKLTFPVLFRDIEDGSDPDADYPTIVLAPTVGFILLGFAAVTPDNETQAMFIFTSPSGNAAQLLQDIAGTDEVEEYDEDHFNYTDPSTGLSAEALDFESDHGPVIEIRFTVSQSDADRLPSVIAERLQGRPEVAHLIVDEDWAEFEFQRMLVQFAASGKEIRPVRERTQNNWISPLIERLAFDRLPQPNAKRANVRFPPSFHAHTGPLYRLFGIDPILQTRRPFRLTQDCQRFAQKALRRPDREGRSRRVVYAIAQHDEAGCGMQSWFSFAGSAWRPGKTLKPVLRGDADLLGRRGPRLPLCYNP
ncbi:hypothetical protein GQR58_002372 [Nymphon striatum]|nr:hypothetical protein GQR58_002372 [Nymphon striatum]